MQAAVMGQGGEIYVLDMGEPVRIRDLAEQMIRLAGKEPGRDIAIEYTGLRPGEKLTEELFYPDEEVSSTGHAKIRLARQRHVDRASVDQGVDALLDLVRSADEARLVAQLRVLVPEFRELAATVGDVRVVPLRARRNK
jgi:FlaA1/EpsC-like NDP-sugar epimerase